MFLFLEDMNKRADVEHMPHDRGEVGRRRRMLLRRCVRTGAPLAKSNLEFYRLPALLRRQLRTPAVRIRGAWYGMLGERGVGESEQAHERKGKGAWQGSRKDQDSGVSGGPSRANRGHKALPRLVGVISRASSATKPSATFSCDDHQLSPAQNFSALCHH